MSDAPGRGLLGWKVWVRTLHLYASLLGLVLLLFFALTGFVLNHGEWFGVGEKTVDERSGRVTARLDPLDDLALVEELRARFDVRGGLVELRADEGEVALRFSRPGEDTDVVVQRDGAVQLVCERGRLADLLTDLHKGERGGTAGGLLVDAAAALLLTISLSGLALWWAMPRRRRAGLIALAAALASTGLVVASVLR